MTPWRAIGVLLLAAVLGTAGYFVGRELVDDGGTEAQQPSINSQLDAVKTQEAREKGEPRFNGRLIGIDIAPSLEQLPQEARQEQQRITEGGCKAILVEEASSLDFRRPLVMADEFVLTEGSPHATACAGTPSGLGWDFTTEGAQGIPAAVSIARVTTKFTTADVPASQVSTQVIGGREGIVIKPTTADGLGQTSQVLFPESFGKTLIYASNLSEDQLLQVAEAVAEASR